MSPLVTAAPSPYSVPVLMTSLLHQRRKFCCRGLDEARRGPCRSSQVIYINLHAFLLDNPIKAPRKRGGSTGRLMRKNASSGSAPRDLDAIFAWVQAPLSLIKREEFIDQVWSFRERKKSDRKCRWLEKEHYGGLSSPLILDHCPCPYWRVGSQNSPSRVCTYTAIL